MVAKVTAEEIGELSMEMSELRGTRAWWNSAFELEKDHCILTIKIIVQKIQHILYMYVKYFGIYGFI